ncbi:hypothetical protein EDB85DRAFT_1897441 [Lactarius pseudohatsudake]|nr:hypothetical protein EDB85DRAFT_1897441 [Lactarius pseudohatsudake]
MALLIISTGQFAIDLGKCTILTGGAHKYRQYNIIWEQLWIYPNPVISSPGFLRTKYFGHLNALLGLRAQKREPPMLNCCFTSSLNHTTIPTPKLIPNLLHELLKAVWRGLKRAIGPLVTRINGMGWRIRMDLKVHLNVVTGLGDVVDWSFGPIQFKFSRGIEAIPSIEGTDQV